jgi:RNA polymerase sigma-70 factor (ECF subfamily)
VPQIATTLGISQGTIKRYLADGIHALRGVLVPEGELI